MSAIQLKKLSLKKLFSWKKPYLITNDHPIHPWMVLLIFALCIRDFNHQDYHAYTAAFIVSLVSLIAPSFGTKFLGLIKALRVPFHTLRFGVQVNKQSPAYTEYLDKRTDFLFENTSATASFTGNLTSTVQAYRHVDNTSDSYTLLPSGADSIDSTKIAFRQLKENIEAQAQILSIFDGYWIFWMGLFCSFIRCDIISLERRK